MATTIPQPADLHGSSDSSPLTCDVLLLSTDQELVGVIAKELTRVDPSFVCRMTAPGKLTSGDLLSETAVIYIPSLRQDASMLPDLVEAEAVCRLVSGNALSVFILVSSAAIYGASFRNPGQLLEASPLPKGKSSSASQWLALERLAQRHWDLTHNLAILRCATVLSRGCCANLLARELAAGVAFTAAGHDPSIQLLSPTDLGQATACLLHSGATGIFNAAPDEPIPLKQAFRRVKARRSRFLALSFSPHAAHGVEGLLINWTTSGTHGQSPTKPLRKEDSDPGNRAFRLCWSSETHPRAQSDPLLDGELIKFDKFGMDKNYIQFLWEDPVPLSLRLLLAHRAPGHEARPSAGTRGPGGNASRVYALGWGDGAAPSGTEYRAIPTLSDTSRTVEVSVPGKFYDETRRGRGIPAERGPRFG